MPKVSYDFELRGYVGGKDFNVDLVRDKLNEAGDNPVSVLIDSLGGEIATGLSIAALFRNHGNVCVRFSGLNASAATVAALGAARVEMEHNAMYLVHKCSREFFSWASMNADDFRALIADATKASEDLDKLDANIAAMYAARSQKEQDVILDLMARGGWLSANEALDWGFVDEVVVVDNAPEPVVTDILAVKMSQHNIPIPNVALVSTASPLERFINSVSDFFSRFSNMPNNNAPAQQPDNLSEIVELKNQLAQANASISALKNRIAELQKQPAEISAQVNDPGKAVASPASDFADTVNAAKALFNLLP